MAGCNTQLKNNNGVGPLDLDLKNNKDVIMDVVKTRQEKSNTANEAIYKEAVALFNQKASLGIEHLNKVTEFAVFIIFCLFWSRASSHRLL